MTKAKISPAKIAEYEAIYAELKRVSHEALATATPPTPMIVGTPTTPLGNDIDYSKTTYFVADGLCGFAWPVLESGRSGFAKWILATGRGSKHWVMGLGYKGVTIWGRSGEGFAETRQSYQLKMQVAGAQARYLTSIGIPAYATGRLD